MISRTETFVAYTANGTQNSFSFEFYVPRLEDLKIYSETTAGVRSDITSYISSVTNIGNELGGSVTLSITPSYLTKVFIVRLSAFTQTWNASELNLFDPADVERVVDKLTLLAQEAKSVAQSSIRLDSGETLTPLLRSDRKGKLVGFNSTDGSFEYTDKAAFTTSVSNAAVAAIQPSVDAAANSASAASGFADDAATSAQDSADSASAASGFASAASGSASSAFGFASAASGSASAAAGSALDALGYRNSASSSAAAALNSQNAAAASASTALNAQATEYLGAIAGTAVPATATTKGQYYLITSGGTSQSVTWTVGDKAVYNGTSGSWSRITGFNAASNTYAEGVGATRVGSGYLYSDGVTTNRAQVQVPGSRGNLAGASQASWVGWVEVPTANPSVPIGIAHLVSSATSVYPTNWSMVIQVSTAGALELFAFSNNGFTDRRQSVWSTFRSTYPGQRVWLDVRFTNGSSKPTVFVNGTDFTSSFTDTATGTLVPSWLDSGLIATYSHTGYNWPAGTAPLGCWLNAHLTNTESEAWRITGRPPMWVAQGGVAANLVSTHFIGTQNGVTNSGNGITGTTTFTGTSTGNAFFNFSNSSGVIVAFVAGLQYRVRATSVKTSGSDIKIYTPGAPGGSISLSTGSVDVIFTCTNTTGVFLWVDVAGNSYNIAISNIKIEQLGALSLPQVQPGNANVLDATAIGGNDATLIGMTGVTGTDIQFTEAAIDARSISRAPVGYLYCDGATSSRGQVQIPGSRGNLAGAPFASWVGWVDVPASAVGADTQIFSLSSTISANPWAASSLYANLAVSGNLSITQVNTTLTNRRGLDYAGFRAAYSGQRIWLEVRFTFGSTDPVVRVNGRNISSYFSASTAGTVPNWLDAGTPSTYALSGMNWPAGIAPLGCWLNAHLTDAESDNWRLTGRPPFWVSQGGAMRDYVSNFTTADTDGWGNNNANNTRTSNIDQDADGLGVPPSNDWLRISKTVSAGTTDTLRNVPRLRGIGAVNRYSGDVFVPSTFPAGLALGIRRGGPDYVVLTPLTPGTTTSFQVTTAHTGTSLYDIFGICTLNGALSAPVDPGVSWYLKNLVIDSGGALSLPAVQSINVVEDITAIGGNQARLVGMTPVLLDTTPVSVIEIPARSFAANTYYEILGGAITGARKRRIVSVTGNSTATGAMHIGTTNLGTQILGNVNVSAGDYDIGNGSFNSRIVPANSSLFVMFSNATTASIHIHLTDL